jgi:hypothetical protein
MKVDYQILRALKSRAEEDVATRKAFFLHNILEKTNHRLE